MLLFAVSDCAFESFRRTLDDLFPDAERKTDISRTSEAATGNGKDPFIHELVNEPAFIRQRRAREEVKRSARHCVFDPGSVKHSSHRGAAFAVDIQIDLRINARFQKLLGNGRRIHISENTGRQRHSPNQLFRSGHCGIHGNIPDPFARQGQIL